MSEAFETACSSATTAMPASREPRYFIPIRTNAQTAYRTRPEVLSLVNAHGFWDRETLIVVGHDPQAWQAAAAASTAQAAPCDRGDLTRLLWSVAGRREAHGRSQMLSWRALSESDGFRAFRERLFRAFLQCPDFLELFGRLSRARAEPAASALATGPKRHLGTPGLGDELAVSIYCTEVLGYWHEIWERPPEPGALDPLAALYADHPEVVARACGGNTPRRRQSLLAEHARR